jgi:hypothetical protein
MTPVRRVLLSLSVFLSAVVCAAVVIPAAAGPALASTAGLHQTVGNGNGSDIYPWPCCW